MYNCFLSNTAHRNKIFFDSIQKNSELPLNNILHTFLGKKKKKRCIAGIIWKAKFLRKDCKNNLSSDEDERNVTFFVHPQFILDRDDFRPKLFCLYLKVKCDNNRYQL